MCIGKFTVVCVLWDKLSAIHTRAGSCRKASVDYAKPRDGPDSKLREAGKASCQAPSFRALSIYGRIFTVVFVLFTVRQPFTPEKRVASRLYWPMQKRVMALTARFTKLVKPLAVGILLKSALSTAGYSLSLMCPASCSSAVHARSKTCQEASVAYAKPRDGPHSKFYKAG